MVDSGKVNSVCQNHVWNDQHSTLTSGLILMTFLTVPADASSWEAAAQKLEVGTMGTCSNPASHEWRDKLQRSIREQWPRHNIRKGCLTRAKSSLLTETCDGIQGYRARSTKYWKRGFHMWVTTCLFFFLGRETSFLITSQP